MTREAKAQIVRGLARRILALGGSVPDPETLNDSDESVLALIAGVLSTLERRSTDGK